MPKCEKCGAELPENVTICSKCCTGLNRPAGLNYMASPSAEKKNDSKKSYKLIIAALIAVVMVLIIALLGVIFVPKIANSLKDNPDESVSTTELVDKVVNPFETTPHSDNKTPEKDNGAVVDEDKNVDAEKPDNSGSKNPVSATQQTSAEQTEEQSSSPSVTEETPEEPDTSAEQEPQQPSSRPQSAEPEKKPDTSKNNPAENVNQ